MRDYVFYPLSLSKPLTRLGKWTRRHMKGKLGKIILKEHLNHCVKEGIERGDVDILTRFNTVLDKYL